MTTDLVSVDYWVKLQHDAIESVTTIDPVMGDRIFSRVFHFGAMRDFGIIRLPGSGYIPEITTKRNEPNHFLVTFFRDIIDSTAYYNELISHKDADISTVGLLSTGDEEFQREINARLKSQE